MTDKLRYMLVKSGVCFVDYGFEICNDDITFYNSNPNVSFNIKCHISNVPYSITCVFFDSFFDRHNTTIYDYYNDDYLVDEMINIFILRLKVIMFDYKKTGGFLEHIDVLIE